MSIGGVSKSVVRAIPGPAAGITKAEMARFKSLVGEAFPGAKPFVIQQDNSTQLLFRLPREGAWFGKVEVQDKGLGAPNRYTVSAHLGRPFNPPEPGRSQWGTFGARGGPVDYATVREMLNNISQEAGRLGAVSERSRLPEGLLSQARAIVEERFPGSAPFLIQDGQVTQLIFNLPTEGQFGKLELLDKGPFEPNRYVLSGHIGNPFEKPLSGRSQWGTFGAQGMDDLPTAYDLRQMLNQIQKAGSA